MRKILILLGAVAVFLTGCGDDSSSGTPVTLTGNTTNKGTKDLSGSEIEIEADDFYFSPTFIKGGTPGATVTVKLKNDGKNPHTFTSTALGVDEQVNVGESKDVTITLPQSGATEFHCRFHQSNGMQGSFFFKDGDTVVGASPGGPSSIATSSSSTTNGGYNYPN
jgi:plastocyanin